MINSIKITICFVAALILLVNCQTKSNGNSTLIETSEIEEFATVERPTADARGIITYEKYQVLIANGEETIEDTAARLGINAERFALYNGLIPKYRPRKGELLALHKRIDGNTVNQSNDWSETSTKEILNKASSKFNTKLSLPSNPIKHKVESGETAYSIARLYKVSVTSLAKWNGLDPEFTIYPGRELIIPVPVLKDVKIKTTKSVTSKKVFSPPQKKKNGESKTNKNSEIKEIKQNNTKEFIMPLNGKIIKKYNTSSSIDKNEGIDIEALPNSTVVSSSNGKVALITDGTDKIGKIILIKHKNNFITLYARINNITVKKDEIVAQGQKIGTTMNFAGEEEEKMPTLHFEIRKGTKSEDPEKYFN